MYELDHEMSFEAQIAGALKHYVWKIFVCNWQIKYGLGFAFAAVHRIVGEAGAILGEHWFQIGFFFLLIVTDHLTGWAASKLNGEPTMSRAWRIFSLKLAIYYPPIFLLILSPHIIENTTAQGVFGAGLDMILVVYAIGEIISLRENFIKGNDLLTSKLKAWIKDK